MRRTYWSPPVDSGFVAAVKQGAIRVVPAVESFTATEVVLADGSRVRPDVVISATGYATGLRPLVGHLGVLDEDDEPKGRQPTPGLFFAGFTYGLIALLPHVGPDARWIARAAATAVRGGPRQEG